MDPFDRDMMIRTVLGEARGQPPVGQAAVASVILNRLKSGRYGSTPTDIVLAKKQFEPWQTRAKELYGIPTSSAAYQNAGKIVDAVASGAPDPTNGATHFANVDEVKKRNDGTVGNNGWINAKNQTAEIGDHTFFAPHGPVDSNRAIPDGVSAYAPSTAPAGGPAMDQITQMLQNALQRGPQQQQASDPIRGFLGRGLMNLFSGNGFHIGPVGPNPANTPLGGSMSALPPAAAHVMAPDLSSSFTGTNSLPTGAPDSPIPMPPARPADMSAPAPAMPTPPVQAAPMPGASAAPPTIGAGMPIVAPPADPSAPTGTQPMGMTDPDAGPKPGMDLSALFSRMSQPNPVPATAGAGITGQAGVGSGAGGSMSGIGGLLQSLFSAI